MPQPGGRYTPHPAETQVDRDPWLTALYNFGPAAGSPGGMSLKDLVEGTGAFSPGGPLTHVGSVARVPGAIASGFRNLPTVAGAAGTGLLGGQAGMFPANIDPLLQRVRRMAQVVAKKEQDIPDVAQAGHEAGLKMLRRKGGTGEDYMRAARGAGKNVQKVARGGTGAREADVRLVQKAQAQFGDQGHDVWLKWLQKTDPAGKWNLDKLRQVQAGTKRDVIRLDKPGSKAGEMLRADDDPAARAELRQAVARLPKNLREVAQKLSSGELDPEDLPTGTIGALRRKLKGFDTGEGDISAVPTKKLPKMEKPIAEAEGLIVEETKKRPLRGIAARNKGTTLTPKPRQISGGSGFESLHPFDPYEREKFAALSRRQSMEAGGSQPPATPLPPRTQMVDPYTGDPTTVTRFRADEAAAEANWSRDFLGPWAGPAPTTIQGTAGGRFRQVPLSESRLNAIKGAEDDIANAQRRNTATLSKQQQDDWLKEMFSRVIGRFTGPSRDN